MAIDAKPKEEYEFIGDLAACNAAAKAAGFRLIVRGQEIQLHYPPAYLLKIYPANGRLYWDRRRPLKFLHLTTPYGLIDIIHAATAVVPRKDEDAQ